MLKSLAVLLLLSLLGCSAPKTRHAAQVPLDGAIAAHDVRLPPAGVYRLDPQRSELRVLVYKAGALSNLGHNHVLVNRSLAGRVEVGDTLPTSTFSLSAPAAAFIVDDEQARREEGDDFPGDISADAKAGTLHNLLSAAVLDAAVHPQIVVRGVAGMNAAGAASTALDIEVAGHISHFVVPLAWQPEAGGFSAMGSIDISQTSLGLQPYSLFLGALQVRDDLVIKFRFVAVGGPL